METNRIRQFCAVAETQNLRQAAEVLNMTHGALSKSLKVLEQELRFDLFQKDGRGITLTDEGREFYPKAIEFLELTDRLLSNEKDLDKRLRIGTFEAFSTYFFSHSLINEFPDYNISLHEMLPGSLEQSLLNNEIDLAITYSPIPTQGIDILKIGTCKMGIYGRSDKYKKIDLKTTPFIAPVSPIKTPSTGAKGLDGWPDGTLERFIKYKVDMMETAIQLCAKGHGVGYFPTFIPKIFNQMSKEEYKLSQIKPPKELESVTRGIYIIKRKSSEESIEIKKIAKTLRKL